MPQVTLIPTGQSFTAETGETVLAAALRAGLNLPHSCKGGHCASCRARIVDGTVGYAGDAPPGITADEVREGYALLCQAMALTDLRVEGREVRPAPDVEVKSLPCRIDRMELVAADVMAVFLRLPAVEELHYRPGQYLDVMLSEGRRRSFSIASAPADGRQLELHVRRASTTGFTAQLFESMHAGALLRIEGPLGQFWFRSESPRTGDHGRRRHGVRAAQGDAPAVARYGRPAARDALLGRARRRRPLRARLARGARTYAARLRVPAGSFGSRGIRRRDAALASCTKRCWPTTRTSRDSTSTQAGRRR